MAQRPNCTQFLIDSIAALDDDFTKPWSDYPCLLWPFTLYKKDPYGLIHKVVDGRKTTRRVHREAWALVNGVIAPGVEICHRCDNPPCYRPIHLFAGSHGENMEDCYAKERHIKISSIYPERLPRGEAHHNSKLTEAEVLEIRSLYPQFSQTQLGIRFGVSQTLIGFVVRGEIWKHV